MKWGHRGRPRVLHYDGNLKGVDQGGAAQMASETREGKSAPFLRSISLITHGLFAFVQGDRELDILTPTVPEHVCAAGSWGTETSLAPNETYVLQGVESADDPILRPENCLTISRRKSGITSIDASKETYCIIRSPLPKAFNVLRAIEREKTILRFSTDQERHRMIRKTRGSCPLHVN